MRYVAFLVCLLLYGVAAALPLPPWFWDRSPYCGQELCNMDQPGPVIPQIRHCYACCDTYCAGTPQANHNCRANCQGMAE